MCSKYTYQNYLFFAVSSSCMACVTSPWGCQWNTRDHTCSDKDDSIVSPYIIGHRKVSPSKRSQCLPSLIVNVKERPCACFKFCHVVIVILLGFMQQATQIST